VRNIYIYIYIYIHTYLHIQNSGQKEIPLIAPKNKRFSYFQLMFGRPQIIGKHTGLKV
jgi:hypothetical protein